MSKVERAKTPTRASASGAVSEAEGDQCHATSGAHLRELLRGNHRYVFTLIQKFRLDAKTAAAPSPSESKTTSTETKSSAATTPAKPAATGS